jgi:hypothetical protein
MTGTITHEESDGALTFRAFCDRYSISRTVFYEEIISGRLIAKKCGGKTLIPYANARAWLGALPKLAIAPKSDLSIPESRAVDYPAYFPPLPASVPAGPTSASGICKRLARVLLLLANFGKPKAKYLLADRELTYWTQKEKDDPSDVPWITDSVLPIVEAKRAQIVKSDFALNESIQFIPTPGHTIDHYSVVVGQPGRDAFITGDMIHSPIQGKYPELGMRADYDSRQAGQTRRKVFDRFCDTSTIMCVVHFPSPSTGRVRRWGDGFKFVA